LVSAEVIELSGSRCVLAVVRDISDRKRAEVELRESAQRFRTLAEASFEGVALTEHGVVVDLNHQLARMLGGTREDFIGHPVMDSVAPESRALVEAALAEERLEPCEHLALRRDGSVFSVEIRVRRMEVGGRRLRVTAIRDITDRKRAEEALLRSETRYRYFSELTSDYVYSCTRSADQPYRVEWVGGAFERISGYPVEHLLQLGCWLPLVHVEDRERIERYLDALTPGQTGAIEFRLVAADGSMRWIRETSRCVPHEDRPDQLRLYGTSQDITERRRVEEEQRRLEEHIRHVQKLESLGVLAGGIAHDFNNLLMAILGNADLALLALSPASPARQNIEEIGTASRRAAELCRQMLAYSGKGHFVVEKLDLSALVREMANILEVSVSKKATLRCHFTEGLPAVEADATQVRQVVMNLITNASEALGESAGVISISTGAMAYDRGYLLDSVSGTDLPAGRYVFLAVSDTGCGMDAGTQRRIFDPFFTTKFTGRGLGLAAVLGIVRGHGGSIKVLSQPGKGTTFTVLLPALDTPARPAEKAVAAPQPWHGDGTVLLVDDEAGVRRVGEEMLEVLGFRVLTAADGVEAVEVFRRHADAIACVILDLTMPRMNGEEAFRELRRIRGDVRVVLSSGYDEQDVTRRFFGEGPTGFVQKPYSVDVLREVVQRALA
jgi:PAS domain S-box-containing protein